MNGVWAPSMYSTDGAISLAILKTSSTTLPILSVILLITAGLRSNLIAPDFVKDGGIKNNENFVENIKFG